MAIEHLSSTPPEKKVWVVIDVPWLAAHCGVKPTGQARVVLGKIHLEAIIPDVPETAGITPGALVMVTGQNLFVPQGIAVIQEKP